MDLHFYICAHTHTYIYVYLVSILFEHAYLFPTLKRCHKTGNTHKPIDATQSFFLLFSLSKLSQD